MLALGEFRIHLIRAGVYWWDGGAFYGVAPKVLWGPRTPVDELNRIPAGLNCYLIETGDQNVLIETGGGVRHDERARERMRMPESGDPLLRALRAAGFAPKDVSLVINTHLHWDHCGGNTVGDGEPMFPSAIYMTQRGEWEHAMERHPRDSVSYRDINYEPLRKSGQMRLVDGDQEPVRGIQLEVVPGHNRDMMVVKVRSGGETFCMLSDLVPTAINLQPTWVAAFDLFPVTAIDNKFRILKQAADEGWYCAFAHDHEIAFTRIRYDAAGRYTLDQPTS